MPPETRDLTRAYARAILAVAQATGRLDQVESDLRDVDAMYGDSTELREFLSQPGLAGAGKRAALEQLLNKRVDTIVLSHLGLMAEEGHGRYLHDVVEAFITEAAQARGSLNADVTTAVELTSEQSSRLELALTRRTGRAIAIRNIVDPDVGGGVVVRLGDQIIDGSVRSRMNRLRNTLTA